MTIEAVDLSDLRVLVIDDNVDAANSLSYLLQMIGCRTAVAYGGEMGLRIAGLFRPGLVFLDQKMPGLDGCEVLAQARESGEPLARAMVVCLTGVPGAQVEVECRQAGFDAFVRKPLEPPTLYEVLQQAQGRATANVALGWTPISGDAGSRSS
jgi:CheY-like chemotaxis protein